MDEIQPTTSTIVPFVYDFDFSGGHGPLFVPSAYFALMWVGSGTANLMLQKKKPYVQ
jgi:hypothetical protein